MMLRTPLRYVDRPAVVTIVLLLNFAVGGALAAGPGGARPVPDGHQAGSAGTGPATTAELAPDPIRGRIESLSMHEVKQFYLGCSNSALRGRLDSAGTALCSIGYDVLLRRHFGGDFHALLAWSRNQANVGDSAIGIDGD
jgi:hypothetical protein